jgi:plasmid stabilization system protein ParE
MSLSIEVSQLARRDLRAILLYIARQNGDLIIASRLEQKFAERFTRLARAPGSGAPHHGKLGVRKIVEGPYRIYYRPGESTLVILRIWDGRRGHDPLL